MIECIKYRKLQKGSALGYADLFIPKMGLEIYGCALFQKGDQRWLNLPSKQYEVDGEKKYSSIVRFREKAHYEAFQTQAKQAIDDWLNMQQTLPAEDIHAVEPEEPLPF